LGRTHSRHVLSGRTNPPCLFLQERPALSVSGAGYGCWSAPTGLRWTAGQPCSGPEGALSAPHRQTHGNLGTSSQPNSGPDGALSNTPPPNPRQSRNQIVDPVSLLDLMPSIILSVAQGAKPVGFRRLAPPTSNSVSRNRRGPVSQPHNPCKIQKGAKRT